MSCANREIVRFNALGPKLPCDNVVIVKMEYLSVVSDLEPISK